MPHDVNWIKKHVPIVFRANGHVVQQKNVPRDKK